MRHLPFYGSLLCLFLLMAWPPLAGQDTPAPRQLRVEHFSAADGLVDDGVWSLAQDERGMLWLGTQRGLVRYDGVEMQLVPESASYNVRNLIWGPDGALWIGDAAGQILHFDPRRETFRTLWSDTVAFWPGQDITARAISFDRDSLLWVSTFELGLFCLRFSDWDRPDSAPRLAAVQHFDSYRGSFPSRRAWQQAVDLDGRLWVASSRGLVRPDPGTETYELYQPEPATEFRLANHISALARDAYGKLWAGGAAGRLYCFDPGSERFATASLRLHPGIDSEHIVIIHLYIDRQQHLWITYRDAGHDFGIVRYDIRTGRSYPIVIQAIRRPEGYFRYETKSIREDRDGNIWFGMHNGGLLKYSPYQAAFRWIATQPHEPGQWRNDPIGKVMVDPEGGVWLFGQDRLLRWDQGSGTSLDLRERWPDINFSAFLYANSGLTHDQEGQVWLWSPNGLFRYRNADRSMVAMQHHYPALDSLVQMNIRGVAVAPDQSLWLCSYHDLFRFDPESGRVQLIYRWSKVEIDRWNTDWSGLYFDSRGHLWIGTNSNGFFRYAIERDSLVHFDFRPGRLFVEDRAGAVYVGSYGDGVVRVDPHDLSTRTITTVDGLPSNKIRGGLLLDHRNRLWVGTNNGLCSYDLHSESSRIFQAEDGLPADLFTSVMADSTARGELVFGTLNGAMLFHPDSIRISSRPPELVFRDFQLLDDLPGPAADSLRRLAMIGSALELRHWQSDFTIAFAALHFKNPANNQYAVWLEPYETEWRSIGTQREVTYTNLDPGQYTFRVKAANSDGVWNEEGIALAIEILPPWYWNGWSQAAYLLLFLGILYTGYRFQLNRQLAEAEAERLRAMDETKNRIYTNITHEFRTPLTVIDGTTEQIDGHEEEKEVIHRNSQQLMLLVNRMLGLAKLEAGETQLNLIHGDILHFLRYVAESFHSLAINQRINLNFHTELDQLEMDYDPEKVLQLLSNLISNAIKFTPEYGKVTIVAREQVADDDPTLELEVRDTGIGIAEADLPTVFDRFHQLEAGATRRAEGTGIGLALVKELVEVLEGRISVVSTLGEGTAFTVQLPIRHSAQAGASPTEQLAASPLALAATREPEPTYRPVGEAAGEVPQLLIVEDNRDVQHYLAACLRDEYELLFARNGREGIDSAREHIPDLIISDVMMPEVDGFELCRTLKQDERTDHIPIILLTAKADPEAKLEGLEYGADAYLTKPFHRRELEIRLERLLELRRKLQAKYRRAEFATEPATERQDAFVQRVRQAVLDRIDDDSFDIEALSQALHLHRSQLHRKLKALTGQSTSHFVRRIRLQEAYRLLQAGTDSVKEVAYAVGFSSASYFSRVFSREFGVPPSQVGPENSR